MRRWSHATAKEAIDVEASHFIPMLKMPEAREAFLAFAEKRKPDFSRF
jgi:1,4-dihydroxy-2-naphthoyl-CoA synthase